jgi:hypothetical protein
MSTKIHSFLKQCLRNPHFFKTRYFPRNLSINYSIHVPCFDKLKIVHNTVLKMNGLFSESFNKGMKIPKYIKT